ncbi:MAG: phosphomannomutase/phosphoglucomutase [Acidobacteriota bacterium]|nr:phosphomannomutase/phosphoglucomutase [Acidobacteriota bacterium]
MAGIFKAYDVRGIYPSQLDEKTALAIGRAFHHVLDEDVLARTRKIVVGRDMRPHSEPLCAALIEGLRSSGLDVIDIGLATTPMNYFAVGHLDAAGGVQVTASHNPAQYNGLKFSRHGARPVSGDHGIPLIEQKVTSGELADGDRRGSFETADIFEAYGDHTLSYLTPAGEADRLRIVVDAANGMGSIYQPLLERMEFDLSPLYFELDGTFPNHEANPLKLENLNDLCNKVVAEGADLGICFDGDADRAAFVDEKGQPIGSDLITALIAGELLQRTPGRAVLFDLRSSRAVPEYIREKGGLPFRERVGHSFIKATLREKDGIFGGELAGHYYFRDNFFADGALLAVVEIINLLRNRGTKMSEIVAPLERYAKSPEINFVVEDKEGKIRELAEKYKDAEIDYLDGITVQYEDWWFNVRPSNTEPYLRLVLEASTQGELASKTQELQALLGEPV